jgi:hypothetical protein
MSDKVSPKFTVINALPTVYTDAGGSPVQGFKVRFSLDDYSEIHYVNVASLDPKTVKAAITTLANQRAALADLGTAS